MKSLSTVQEIEKPSFLAVGRVRDRVALALYSDSSNDQSDQLTGIFRKLLVAAPTKFARGQEKRLHWIGKGLSCYLDARGQILYCAVTSLSYADYRAFALLHTLEALVSQRGDIDAVKEGGLNSMLGLMPKNLVAEYEGATEEEDEEKEEDEGEEEDDNKEE